jgi:hypothetical protein
MLPLIFVVFQLLKFLIVSHRLILPGGHTIPLKIILNNCCTVLSKYHVFFFIVKVIALRWWWLVSDNSLKCANVNVECGMSLWHHTIWKLIPSFYCQFIHSQQHLPHKVKVTLTWTTSVSEGQVIQSNVSQVVLANFARYDDLKYRATPVFRRLKSSDTWHCVANKWFTVFQRTMGPSSLLSSRWSLRWGHLGSLKWRKLLAQWHSITLQNILIATTVWEPQISYKSVLTASVQMFVMKLQLIKPRLIYINASLLCLVVILTTELT